MVVEAEIEEAIDVLEGIGWSVNRVITLLKATSFGCLNSVDLHTHAATSSKPERTPHGEPFLRLVKESTSVQVKDP